MNKFSKLIPISLACVVAFFITLGVRFIIPTSGGGNVNEKNLPMPEIPFIDKRAKQEKDLFILIALNDIKQHEKVLSRSVTWKKWPKEAISSSFIAKDSDGNMLNSSYSYSNVINLFAKYPIAKGTPITMEMLSRKKVDQDGAKRQLAASERAIRKQLEKELTEKFTKEFNEKLEVEKEVMKRKNIELSAEKVKSGMSVITVPIDQRSIASKDFLRIGDRIDLLYPNRNNHGEFSRFINVKILEIDGSNSESALNRIGNSIPRNITVEIEKQHIENLIKHISTGQLAVLLVKNQKDIRREQFAQSMAKNLLQRRENERIRQKLVRDSIENDNKFEKNERSQTNKLFKFAIDAFKQNAINSSNVKSANIDEKAIAKSNAISHIANIAKNALTNTNELKFESKDKIEQKEREKVEKQLQSYITNSFSSKTQNNNVNPLRSYMENEFTNSAKVQNLLDNRVQNYVNNNFKNAALVNTSTNKSISSIISSKFSEQSVDGVDLLNREEQAGIPVGVITISRSNKPDSVSYDALGNIISQEKDTNSANGSAKNASNGE